MTHPQDIKELIECITLGGIGILPTDTVYGLVAGAFKHDSVEQIYCLKKRETSKPFVVLISCVEDLKRFGIKISKTADCVLKKVWPGKVSVILSCKQKRFFHLHRGNKTLAFRIPDDPKLISLLKIIGPLATTSANLSGQPVAKNIVEAKKYFGDQIDFYIKNGELTNSPSSIIEIKGKKVILKRKGEYDIENILKQCKI